MSVQQLVVRPRRQDVAGVAIIGCGLIGRRRAQAATLHGESEVRVLCDTDADAACAAGEGTGAVTSDWSEAIARDDVDVVVVSTPNGLAAQIAIAALAAGRHVLMEKPMGRDLAEAARVHAAALSSGRVLGVGFNHRHHPAIRAAAQLVSAGAIGRLHWLRARYGHGGRPGLEREWRSDPAQAGGGELLDQGIHVLDLFLWLAGAPTSVYGITRTTSWPIAPLEDNAFGVLQFTGGVVAQLHVSMTQWKNLFSLEVHGEAGAVIVEGLGGSYGTERLIRVRRAFEGGAPEVEEVHFEGADESWLHEWRHFMDAVNGRPHGLTGAADGLAAMRVADALYRSAAEGVPVTP
jgi:predicted dehydrogenase